MSRKRIVRERPRPAGVPEVEVETRDIDGVVVRTTKTGPIWRDVKVTDLRRLRAMAPDAEDAADGADDELAEESDPNAVYEFSFSSEAPVEEWVPGVGWALVTLGHNAGEADFSRLNDGAAWRDTHWGDQVGVSERAFVKGGKGYTQGRFSQNQRPQEIERDVRGGIRRNVSAGFIPLVYELVRSATQEVLALYRVTQWVAYHIAFVPDPADSTVGIGRSKDDERLYPVVIRDGKSIKEERTMKKKVLDERGLGVIEVDDSDPRSPLSDEQVRGLGVRKPVIEVNDTDPSKKTRKQEVEEIRSACKEYAVPDAVTLDIISRELTPDQARNEILVHVAKTRASAQPGGESLEEIMGSDAADQYLYGRAAAMAANVIRRDGVEAEAHAELMKRTNVGEASDSGQRFLIPWSRRDLRNSKVKARTLTTTGHGTGAELVANGPLELIDYLRNKAVLPQVGTTVLTGLRGPIPFAKKTGVGKASWLAQGAAITASDQKFIPLEGGLKRIGAMSDLQRELLLQASLDTEALIQNDLFDGVPVEFDRGALFGVGGVEPLGVWNMPGVQTVAMGGVPTYAKVAQMPGKTLTKNALDGNLAHVSTALMAALLNSTPKFTGGFGGTIWEGAIQKGQMTGYPAFASNQMRSDLGGGANEHAMLFGPWQHVIAMFWGYPELIVDPFTQAPSNAIRFVINLHGNVLCRYPEAFVAGTGATLS